jgi:signal transduction histidine kinase
MMTQSARPAAPSESVPGRLSARQRCVDAAIAVAVAVIEIGGSYAITTAHPVQNAVAAPVGYGLLAAGSLALVGRRRYPVAVLGFVLAMALTGAALGVRTTYLALIIAFFTVVLARKRAAAIASLIIGYLGSILPGLIRGTGPTLAVALGLLAWLLVLLSAAELLRARRQRAAQLERAREDELRHRATQERLAIARDLHDVLAHNISVINVQANTALHLMDRQPERAREALTAIHDVSKQALTELRSVLGVLRTGEQAPLAPGPGIDDLGDLVLRASSTGLRAELSYQGDPRPVPAEAGVAAYRIVQEALTNAARHAAGSTARVTVNYRRDALTVRIEDDGPVTNSRPARSPQAESGSGSGLTGMRERAQALGGSLEAGPRPAGGFGVLAVLPLGAP